NSTDRFTWQMASPQTVYYVLVSNAEATVNNIRAETSSAGVNTDRLDTAPHWIFANPSQISIATGRFTMSSGTGDLAVTGVGFQPKAYILFLTKNDTDDTDSAEGSGLGSQLSIGMTDGTNQFCMTSGVEDDQGTSDVGRRGFETSQGSEVGNAVACNIDVGSGSQDVRGEAAHVSMDVDGFTINRSVTFTEPTNVLVEYIAFGGADLTAHVDLVNLNNTLDASVNETAPGFEPDLVITSFTGKYLDATGNSDNDDDSISYGWAINPSIQPTDNQFSITKSSRDGQSTATGQTRIDSSYAGISFRDGTIDTGFEIENFDASGFDVTTRVSASGDNEIMGYLALDLGSNPRSTR
ncbi:MAG: hypothetical protein K8I00_12700, partial [Candidatus Omnitrophica bacterium]|nr:hypothetical protein [Candidatus Omnitrophota bacterium]